MYPGVKVGGSFTVPYIRWLYAYHERMSTNIRNRDASFCGVQPLYRIGGTHVEGGK